MLKRVQVRVQGDKDAVQRVIDHLSSTGHLTDVGSKTNTDGTVRMYGTMIVTDHVESKQLGEPA